MKDVTIDDILSVQDITIKPVYVENWGGKVYVRVMSGYERSELESIFANIKGGASANTGRFRKEILKRTLVDAKGQCMLTDETADKLMSKPGMSEMIETVFEVACELNGFRQRDVDTLKKK